MVFIEIIRPFVFFYPLGFCILATLPHLSTKILKQIILLSLSQIIIATSEAGFRWIDSLDMSGVWKG